MRRHTGPLRPALGALLLAACAPAATVSPPAAPTDMGGTAPVRTATLAPADSAASDSLAARVTALADEYMNAALERYPEYATQLGLPGMRHDRVTDNSLASMRAWEAREDAWLAQLRGIDPDVLVRRPEWVTYGFLREQLESSQQTRVCHNELWGVSQMFGWQTSYPLLAQFQPVGTPEARQQALARARALPGFIDTEIGNVKLGVRQGYTAPRGNVQRVLDQIDGLLEPAPAKSPFMAAADRDSTPEFRRQMRQVVVEQINPALRRYRDYLRSEYLPAARESVAISALPSGEQCYRAATRSFTTVDMEPRAIHELGLRQMDTIHAEMRTIARRSFNTDDVPALLQRLKTDPRYTFRTRQGIVDYAQAAVNRAKAAMPKWFGTLPKADVIIQPYAPFEEGSAPDSYNNPAEDGSRPGMYRINTSNPTGKSKAGVESTAFHETIPGHHLQIAIAQERKGAHPITRFLGNSGYTEGWALYAERLADEMGLFSGDLDRLGMLSNQAFRAARLVVDPGIHTLGWTRQQAIDYMVSNTAESREEATREIDRYIILPGQATAYMIGQLEILRLRAEAERELGARFDIKRFHDVVLGSGAVTLPMLRQNVERWIIREKAGQA